MKTLHLKAYFLKIFKIFAKPEGKNSNETKQNQAKNKEVSANPLCLLVR